MGDAGCFHLQPRKCDDSLLREMQSETLAQCHSFIYCVVAMQIIHFCKMESLDLQSCSSGTVPLPHALTSALCISLLLSLSLSHTHTYTHMHRHPDPNVLGLPVPSGCSCSILHFVS